MGKLFIAIVLCSCVFTNVDATMIFPKHTTSTFLYNIPLDFSSYVSPQPYTQFDFGTTRLINSDDRKLPNKMVFSRHIGVGMDFSGNLISLYFSNFGRYTWKISDINVKRQVILDINEFGISYAHRIALSSIVNPYLGVRIGYTYFKLRDTYLDVGGGYSANYGENEHISIGAFGGVEAKITPNFTIGVGIEYGRLRGNDITDLTTKAFTRTYF